MVTTPSIADTVRSGPYSSRVFVGPQALPLVTGRPVAAVEFLSDEGSHGRSGQQHHRDSGIRHLSDHLVGYSVPVPWALVSVRWRPAARRRA